MDPSLIEIIRQAVADARKRGLKPSAQREAARGVVLALSSSLSLETAQLIVDQLYPYVVDLGRAA